VYDALNRLETLTNWKDASPQESDLLSRFEYDHYADGQRASATETLYGWKWDPVQQNHQAYRTNIISYGYDGLNRLIREQWQGRDPNAFEYDLVGNMHRRTLGNKPGDGSDDVTVDYTYNNLDQLTFEDYSVGQDYTYQYDANGSLERKYHGTTSDPFDAYVYNLQGRLATFTHASGDAVTYTYDPDGIRVNKQVGTAAATTYLIDPMNPTGYAQVFVGDDGTTKTMYVLGSDVVAQAAGTDAPMYLLYDGHGSVRNHADDEGDLIWHDIPGFAFDGTDGPDDQDYNAFQYDAWGKSLQTPPGDGLQYTGEMYDADLEWYYNRARYYNPRNGRFNRIDEYPGNPEDPQSLHKYLYCSADPVGNVDPLGLFTQKFGYLAEAAIQAVYAMDHPGDSVSYGKWTMLLPDDVPLAVEK
jgi:RHS repeat-associated protein